MATLPSGTITFLFTDVEGSTRLLYELGALYAGALAQYRNLVRNAVRAHGGTEVDTQGDAFFVAFPRASDAVAAAADAQRAFAGNEWPNSLVLRVRMGVHTGAPTGTREGYVGIDVHRGARVMAAGHGGQVLVSEATRNALDDELPDGVSLRDLGDHRLKDLTEPEHLFQLVIDGLESEFPALKTLGNRPTNLPVQPMPLIGREGELNDVRELLRRNDVRLVTLTGAGGTGKTRLALQVAAELLDQFASGGSSSPSLRSSTPTSSWRPSRRRLTCARHRNRRSRRRSPTTCARRSCCSC